MDGVVQNDNRRPSRGVGGGQHKHTLCAIQTHKKTTTAYETNKAGAEEQAEGDGLVWTAQTQTQRERERERQHQEWESPRMGANGKSDAEIVDQW